MKRYRIFFATDIHASERCFKKFLKAQEAYEADIMILGGDITGKMVVPLVEQDGGYKCEFLGRVSKTKEETEKLEKDIRDSGSYPVRLSPKEAEELSSHPSKVDELFNTLMIERLKEWMIWAEEKFKNKNVKFVVSGGNDDPLGTENILRNYDFVIDPEGSSIQLTSEHELVCCSYSNQTPWKCPRELREEELYRLLEDIVSKVSNLQTCIFDVHVPPFDTNIDLAREMELDTLKPKLRDGQIRYVPVGSLAVRTVISTYQPLLGLHGHIHESKGLHKLGRTLCFNPGSEYSAGILMGVIVDIEGAKVKDYLFTSG
jgi:Icc-related predicted phosphoesterase